MTLYPFHSLWIADEETRSESNMSRARFLVEH